MRISASDKGAFGYTASYSYKIINTYSDDQLVELAEYKPNRVKQREGTNGKPMEIFIYDYMYDDGLAIVYKNKSL